MDQNQLVTTVTNLTSNNPLHKECQGFIAETVLSISVSHTWVFLLCIYVHTSSVEIRISLNWPNCMKMPKSCFKLDHSIQIEVKCTGPVLIGPDKRTQAWAGFGVLTLPRGCVVVMMDHNKNCLILPRNQLIVQKG